MLSKKRYEEIRQNIKPQGFLLNLTDQCNLRCYYCFVDHAPHRMTPKVLEDSLEFIFNSVDPTKPISIDFFGGEPMLEYETLIKPTVEKLWADKIHLKYDFRLGMTTNGTLLNEERLKFLKEHKVGLLLSIDGDKETQDYNRACADGKSSFDILAPKLPMILKYYPQVTFRGTITPFSSDKIVDNYLFARNNNFQFIYMTPNSHEEWDDQSRKNLIKGVFEIARLMQIDYENGEVPLFFSPLMSMCANIILGPPERGKDEFSCGWGTVSMGIGTDGRLFGCQERSSHDDNDVFYIGDIYNGIDESRHRKLLAPLEKTIKVSNFNNREYCNSCICKDYCNAGICQAHAEWNTGELTKHVDIECIYDRSLMYAAMELLKYNRNNKNFIDSLNRYLNK